MRPNNPHVAALPTLAGSQPWQCSICGAVLQVPATGPLIGAATALGCFIEAHRHPEA